VPFPAGGGTEIVTRHVSDGLAKRLGQPVVVLNRPGANTNLGTLAVVRAKPDGYTLLITSFGLAANPSLYRKLGFNPQTDLEPITLIANSPTVLTVPPSLPVSSLAELIAYLRARPGALNYASYGVGSSPHLAAELFQTMTGTKLVHVPYGGGAPAAVGVMTSQAQALFSSVVTVLGMVQGGTLKPIAIASERRSPLLPDVPTFAEAGLPYPGFGWWGLAAPKGTPASIVAKLNAEFVRVFSDPKFMAFLEKQGVVPAAGAQADFVAFLKQDRHDAEMLVQIANTPKSEYKPE